VAPDIPLDNILKIATLIVISDSDDLILTKESIELAIAFIDEIEPNMDIVFAGAGRNELSPIAAAIENMINASEEPILLKRIYATHYKEANTDEINDILEHLTDTGKIKLLQVSKGKSVLKLAAKRDYEVDSSQPKPQLGA